MYNPSDDYKEQIKKRIRNLSYLRIRFGLVDPDAVVNAVASDNGHLVYSDGVNVTDELTVTQRYGTLEPGFWLLDGSMPTYDTTTMHQGFVADQVSKFFDMDSVVTLAFTTGVYIFKGLGFKFDTVSDEYPQNVTVTGYRAGMQVYTKTFDIPSSSFVYSHNVPDTDERVDKLTFTFHASRIPYRRIRLENITLGIYKELNVDNIINSKWTRKNDLINSVIPSNAFSFTFYDLQKEYNPDNPEGVWAYLETGQKVEFDYGYMLDSGEIEWIPGGTNYTEGNPSVEKSETFPQVTFNTVSRLENLTDMYDEGIYVSNGISLYDLAESVLRWSGVMKADGTPEYILAEKLKTYKTNAPLPMMEARSLLQLIANAGMCVLYVNRENKIVLEDRPHECSPFKFDLDSVYDDAPEISKYPYLKTLSTKVFTYSPQAETEELTKITVSGAMDTQYRITYDMSSNVTMSLSGTLTVDIPAKIFSSCALITVSGSGTITVSGRRISTSFYLLPITYDILGEDCSLENILITSKEHSDQYNKWMAEVLRRRSTYIFSDRGFPELDTADTVHVDTSYVADRQCSVTKYELVYNGALHGSTEVLGI